MANPGCGANENLAWQSYRGALEESETPKTLGQRPAVLIVMKNEILINVVCSGAGKAYLVEVFLS